MFQTASRALRPIRLTLRERSWRPHYLRLQELRGIGTGRRAFLVGNGPSLRAMRLEELDGEFVCVANMGIRAVGTLFGHADMHVVTDGNRYRRFAADIEAIALETRIDYRFLSRRVRSIWQALPTQANEPFYLVPHIDKLPDATEVPPLSEGVARAPSVLVTAALLLKYLGFSEIYVIGCDLDYKSHGQYFYSLSELDRAHERDPKVVRRRDSAGAVDESFAILRQAFQRDGCALLNAGIGGNLRSLERVDFAGLFPKPNSQG